MEGQLRGLLEAAPDAMFVVNLRRGNRPFLLNVQRRTVSDTAAIDSWGNEGPRVIIPDGVLAHVIID